MHYRNLGRSGLKVSALAFGSWVTFGEQIDEDLAGACMETAREAGVNFFDNAESYAAGKSETMMGGVIKHLGWKRSDLVLSTKIFWGGEGPNDRGLSRKHIVEGTPVRHSTGSRPTTSTSSSVIAPTPKCRSTRRCGR